MRDGMYRTLEASFRAAGIPWDACYKRDGGDSLLVLAPAEIPKAPFAEVVPHALAAALRGHNATSSAEARIRLRMALHFGEVVFDGHDVAGTALIIASRLLNADPLKTALAQSSGTLALIASSEFFTEVIQHSPASNPAAYRAITFTLKETTATAWIILPDNLHASRQAGANGSNHAAAALVPGSAEFFAVVAALESVPCLRHEDTRSLVFEHLSPGISGSVRRYSAPRMQMVSLLSTCLEYQDGVRELLAVLAMFEQNGSAPLLRLGELLRGGGP